MQNESQEEISDILFFFLNDTATTEIYTLPLHDALPICPPRSLGVRRRRIERQRGRVHHHAVDGTRPLGRDLAQRDVMRSEEHTSELQSQSNLVCRLLLEKKK